MLKNLCYITCLLLVTFSQSACMSVASSCAQAVYNRHQIQKNLSDHYITMQAYRELFFKTNLFANSNISIATYNGEVLLAGQVPVKSLKQTASERVKRVCNIKKIYNFLTVASPSSSLIKMSDAWLTAKVKAKLIASNDVDATQIKVVTENGIVYLMGVVPVEDAKNAVEIAQDTAGVLSVVKIFSYMKITKMA